MPHSYGYRARTRSLFSRDFRKHGTVNTSTYTRVFRVGQIVDVKANGAVHKGMPHKFYHGKTGVVWNVTKRAVGVEMNKLVGNRILKKRVHLRIEHVNHSDSRKAFLERVKKNDILRAEAKKNGTVANLKREMPGPRPALFIKNPKIVTVNALKFVGMYQ